MIWWKRKCKK